MTNMTKQTEAINLALDLATMHHTDDGYMELRSKVRALCSEAIEQPEQPQQEPVGEVSGYYERGFTEHKTLYGKLYNQDLPMGAKLYTSPLAQRKPLTDEEIERIYDRYGGNMMNCTRAIERAHGIYAPTELKENT